MKIQKVKDASILKFTDVVMKEATILDEIKAVKIAGTDKGYDFQLALVAQLCTFDGKKYVMEDLKQLDRADFLELLMALSGLKRKDLEKMSSDSQDTEDSHTKK